MSFIKDINQDEFLQDVVEASKTTPVLVDFGASKGSHVYGPCEPARGILVFIP